MRIGQTCYSNGKKGHITSINLSNFNNRSWITLKWVKSAPGEIVETEYNMDYFERLIEAGVMEMYNDLQTKDPNRIFSLTRGGR